MTVDRRLVASRKPVRVGKVGLARVPTRETGVKVPPPTRNGVICLLRPCGKSDTDLDPYGSRPDRRSPISPRSAARDGGLALADQPDGSSV